LKVQQTGVLPKSLGMMGEEGRGGNQEYQEKPSDSQFENQYQISLEIKIGHFTMIEPLPSKIAWTK